MSRFTVTIRWTLLAALAFGFYYRASSLYQVTDPPLSERDDTFPVDGFDAFRFDPDAVVLIGYGVDGAPGRANWDDNYVGGMDDPTEVGAIGSDDECLGPADEGYNELLLSEHARIISRGGFVPVETGEKATRYRSGELGWWIAKRQSAR